MGRWPGRPNISAMRSSRGHHVLIGSSGCGEMRTARGAIPHFLVLSGIPVRRSTSMAAPDPLRDAKIPLTHGSGAIPALGFGTLIPDPLATKQATKAALEAGVRHFDCAERYRNEEAVGDAMQEMFKAGAVERKDVFVTTKLWNSNHRAERVKPAFEASRRRLQIDHVDCYLIHT